MLGDPLHDRIVRILLADGIVTREQVEEAWLRWLRARRDGIEEPLWRELLMTPGIDQESIYEVVALAYAFKPIRINVRGTLILVDRLRSRIPDAQWNELVEHLVLPVVESRMEPGMAPRIAVAAYDPTRDAVRRLVESLDLGPIEVRYAPADEIFTAISEVLPQKKYLVDPRTMPTHRTDRGAREGLHAGYPARHREGSPFDRE